MDGQIRKKSTQPCMDEMALPTPDMEQHGNHSNNMRHTMDNNNNNKENTESIDTKSRLQ
jgi:hypothetical protein